MYRYTMAVIGIATALALSPAALAQTAASGTFTIEGATFKVVDGFAYVGTGEFWSDREAVLVQLFDHPLDRAAAESEIHFEGALARQKSEAGYVKLEFDPDGTWTGSSYMVKGGSGCGYCSAGEVAPKAKVKLDGDHVRGTIKVSVSDYEDGSGAAMDLRLDVPVSKLTGVSPLPADGGEPAKALAACRQAVAKNDLTSARSICLATDDPQLEQAKRLTDEGFWAIAFYGREAPRLTALTVTGGRSKGDWAELYVSGSGEEGERKGSVYMRRTAAGWRYDHEDLEWE